MLLVTQDVGKEYVQYNKDSVYGTGKNENNPVCVIMSVV